METRLRSGTKNPTFVPRLQVQWNGAFNWIPRLDRVPDQTWLKKRVWKAVILLWESKRFTPKIKVWRLKHRALWSERFARKPTVLNQRIRIRISTQEMNLAQAHSFIYQIIKQGKDGIEFSFPHLLKSQVLRKSQDKALSDLFIVRILTKYLTCIGKHR